MNTLRLTVGFAGLVALVSPLVSSAQTTLAAGDLAFTMINSESTITAGASASQFSFVTFKTLAAGTTINFTDVGWGGTAFRSNTSANESYFTYTTSRLVAAGTQITISSTGVFATVATATAGTVNPSLPAGWAGGNTNGLNLDGAGSGTTAGDQIFAFQGSATSPTFIAGLTTDLDNGGTFNTTTGWGANATNVNGSALPTTLVAGTSALSLSATSSVGVYTAGSEVYSAKAADLTGTRTQAEWLAYLNDSANWTKTGGPFTASTAVLSISAIPEPSSCAILAGFGALVGVLVKRKRARK
jgi:hypothetical protein